MPGAVDFRMEIVEDKESQASQARSSLEEAIREISTANPDEFVVCYLKRGTTFARLFICASKDGAPVLVEAVVGIIAKSTAELAAYTASKGKDQPTKN